MSKLSKGPVFVEMQFLGKVTYRSLLLRKITSEEYELRFFIYSQTLRFGIRDFALITGPLAWIICKGKIRQVLHAMRRGENLQIEDYMLFDPFRYHGMAEMHDRHRDMLLDVDNMSSEELLAMEERIGDVSTRLSEETILKLMKQRKYVSFAAESPPDSEPCCICQEEYGDGDDVGALDCGHDFHTDCVKQWLMQKNLCPIFKTTGLLT